MRKERQIHYLPNPRKGGLSPEVAMEVLRLHEAGLSNVQIGKIVGRHNSNISILLNKMLGFSVSNSMANEDRNHISKKPRRAAGVLAPNDRQVGITEVPKGSNIDDSELSQRLVKLEQELKEARMERDLYSEIIKVAEMKFGIQIIKKAGTKQ